VLNYRCSWSCPRFRTRTQQRANQCARKCDSDAKILECGIQTTEILFRSRTKKSLETRASHHQCACDQTDLSRNPCASRTFDIRTIECCSDRSRRGQALRR